MVTQRPNIVFGVPRSFDLGTRAGVQCVSLQPHTSDSTAGVGMNRSPGAPLVRVRAAQHRHCRFAHPVRSASQGCLNRRIPSEA